MLVVLPMLTTSLTPRCPCSRVIELRNDLRALSDKIKELLDVVFARPEPSKGEAKPIEEVLSIPFANCNGVAPGSPAAIAVSYAHIQSSDQPNLLLFASLLYHTSGNRVF